MEKRSNLSTEFLILIQLAQDEMVRLYNCPGSIKNMGYYYDVVDEFNKGWKRLNRAVPKGEYQQYRDAFCEAADGMEEATARVREYFKGKCNEMFEGSVELLAHLVTAKFILKSADYLFTEMYGSRSRLVAEIWDVVDRYAKKFSVKGKGKGMTIQPDLEIVKAFSESLNKVAAEIGAEACPTATISTATQSTTTPATTTKI